MYGKDFKIMKRIILFLMVIAALVMCISSCSLANHASEIVTPHTHQFGEWTITENATCAKAGLTVRYCDCGEEQSASIPKLSHNIVVDEAVEATCTKTGLTEGEHCSLCREILVEQRKVDALGHTIVVDRAVAPTCTKTGLTEGKHCSACNDILVAQTEIPKINHTYDNDNDTDCNVCGFIRNAECPHTNVLTLSAKSATCTEPGLTEGRMCADCEFVIIAQSVIDALGHSEIIDERIEPTRETTGLTEGKHCSRCNTVLIEQQIIPMLSKYTITYVNAPKHDNPDGYYSDESVTLQNATWPGLIFSHWTTSEGDEINSIPEGASGNITLVANWKEIENLFVTCGDNSYSTVYDPNDELYFFVFNIGEMHNVVFEEIESINYNGLQEHDYNYTKAVNLTKSTADTISETVTYSVTNSNSWSVTNQTGINISASLGGEILWLKFGAELGAESTHTTTNSGSSSSGTEINYSTSSTVTFIEDTSTQVTHEYTLKPELYPAGIYRCVNAGTVSVNLIITYDVKTEEYYIDIYSHLTKKYKHFLYEAAPEYNNNVAIAKQDSPDFNIDIEALANYIETNAYSVKYDANDGRGIIDSQKILPGTNANVEFPSLTREYFEFDGWYYDAECKSPANAQDIENAAKNVTLYAKWIQTYPDYIYIFTAEDFKWHIGNNLQKSSKPENCGAGKYMLLNDIDLGDWNEGWGFTYWTANNESTTLNGKTCFTGVFDGQGHTITYKLRVGKTNLQSWAFGLFPVTDGATIRNLKVSVDFSTDHISNADRANDVMAGGLIGYAKGTTVENCSVSGRIVYHSDGGDADTCVAGVIGYAYNSTIKNCSSSAYVYAKGFFVSAAGVMACYYNTSYSELNFMGTIATENDWVFGETHKGQEVARSLKLF